MARGDPAKKCPKCKRKFAATQAGHASFMKHWYANHYTPKKKAKPRKTWKAPKRR